MPEVNAKKLKTWAAEDEDAELPEPKQEADDAEGDGDMEAGGPEKFLPIMEMVEEDADLMETACKEMDPNALMSEEPLDEEGAQKLVSALAFLRPELVEGMKEVMPGTTYDEAMDLGQQLAEEGFCEDGDLVGGFLFHSQEVLDQVTPEHHEAANALTQQAMDNQGAPPEGEEPPAPAP